MGKAQIAEVGRKFSKEIAALISDVITVYDYQERIRRKRKTRNEEHAITVVCFQ